eukprot:scaffold93923_cov54-Attheya_sp.AAC.1
MYRKEGDTWHKHDIRQSNRRSLVATDNGDQQQLPENTVRITDLEEMFGGKKFTNPSIIAAKHAIETPIIVSFDQYISTLPKWTQQLIQSTQEEFQEHQPALHELLISETALTFVTDGGAIEGHGYFGWVIATDTYIIWRGKGKVLGNPHLMESLRTESVGMLSLTLFLLHYCKYHEIELENRNICHYCDNNMVSSITRRRCPSPNRRHHDPTQDGIYNRMGKRTHQTPKEGEELPWEAILNIEADDLAKKNKAAGQDDNFYQYPASRVMLYIAGKPITRNIAKEIRYAWTSQDLREYMTDKFEWKQTTADLIDWYSHGSTLKSYEYYQHVFCVKLIHERLPVLGKKFTASANKICPCCTISEETTAHYMECNLNPHTVEELSDSLKPIFDKHDVDPILRIFIYRATANQCITQDILEELHPIIDFQPYLDLLKEQDKIGWKQILLDRYSITWDRCQRRYIENKYQKSITGEPKWIRNVIRETWKYQKAR